MRIRVKAPTLLLGRGIPDDAQPGDLIVGNRGAAAEVLGSGGCLFQHYVGNVIEIPPSVMRQYRRVYDFSGGTCPWWPVRRLAIPTKERRR